MAGQLQRGKTFQRAVVRCHLETELLRGLENNQQLWLREV
jgi:hypothetical protein